MSSLRYVGRAASESQDITTRLVNTNILNSAVPNRTSVTTQVDTASQSYATKTYVDTQDGQFASPSDYQNADLNLVPIAVKGAVGATDLTGTGMYGVASLDGTGKIPTSQIPVLGSGYILGPFGVTSVYQGSVTGSSSPLKIADIHVGVQNQTCSIHPYSIVMANSNNNGAPVVEARWATSQNTTYSTSTKCGIGEGRSFYDDIQPIVVQPASALGATPISVAGSTDIWVSLWLYNADEQTSTIGVGGIASAAIFLMKVAQ